MAGVVVAVGENCDLMYGSEVWGIVQGAYAQYALATCIIVVGEGWYDPHRWRDQLAVSAGSGRSWTSKPTVVVTAGSVGTVFIAIQLAKVLGTGTVITAATGNGIDFVNGLGADVVVDYHEQNIRYPGQCHRGRCLRQPGFPGVVVTVEGDRAVFLGLCRS